MLSQEPAPQNSLRSRAASCVRTSAASQFDDGADAPGSWPARGGVAKAPQRLPARAFVRRWYRGPQSQRQGQG